jgi:hypothetical protein
MGSNIRERIRQVLDPALLRLGHHANDLLLPAVVLAVADDALGHHVTAVTWLDTGVWTAWILALVADVLHHQKRLCERCISAAPTLDPQSAVKRWHAALRAHHSPRAMIVSSVAVLAAIFYLATVKHEHPWQYALDAVAVTVLGASFVIGHQHRRLYPWCPFCRWDKGGDEEIAPPVPVVPQVR